jgi:hypothetical protein
MRVRFFLAASIAALGFALAAPAGAVDIQGDGYTVTGDLGVGGTITITDDDPTICDGESGAASLLRSLGNNTFVPIVSNGAPLVEGQVWSVTLTIPATDKGNPATALTPGMLLILDVDGICNAFEDRFGFQRDPLEVTLGEPISAPTTTTTTTTAPAATTTTVTAAAPTTAAAASTTPATAAPAAAELPRTGGSATAPVVVALAAIAVGTALVAGRPRSARRT